MGRVAKSFPESWRGRMITATGVGVAVSARDQLEQGQEAEVDQGLPPE